MKKLLTFIKENKTMSIVIATALIILVMSIFGNEALAPFNN